MGSIVYEYRNRIVELENETEDRESRIKLVRMCIASAFFSLLLVINTDAFDALNQLNKITLVAGAALLSLCAYELTKDERNTGRMRTMALTGLAFTVTSLFAMMM